MSSTEINLSQVFTHTSDSHKTTIHWTSIGPANAPPVIFIHGTPWSSYTWAAHALALSTRYKVYLFDRPGFGASPDRQPLHPETLDSTTELDGSLSGQAASFAALYTHWAFHPSQPPHVIAHDNAGLVALRAHLTHGTAYASLCLVDVVAVPPFGSPLFRLIGENRPVFDAIPDSVHEGILRSYIRDASARPLAKDVEDKLVRPWTPAGSQGPHAFIRQLVQADQRFAADVEPRYAEVGAAMPVKVVWGLEDRWIPAERAKTLAEGVAARELVFVDGAGHLIMFDQPERLAVEIAVWLGSVAVPAPALV